MANVLGSLQVELTANTAKFVGELGKAAVLAQQSAKNISREFSSLQRVASQTFGAFGSLNPAISQVSFALSTMGRAASEAMKEFGSTKNAFGAIASIAAGAAVGVGALEVSMIGLALKAVSSAAEMEHLAQKSGVTVEEMSALSFAAKQVNLSQDQLSLALARLSKNAAMAAEGSKQQSEAFRALGVNVKDAQGNLRPIGDLILDIADRFSRAKDSTAKTAIAMQAFGKAGYEMIPFLNLGKAGIEAFMKQAEELGIVLNARTAQGAVELEQKMNVLGAKFQGFEIQLARGLLPTLDALVDRLSRVGLAESKLDGPAPFQSWAAALQNTVVLFAEIASAINEVAYAFEDVINLAGVIGTLGLWEAPKKAILDNQHALFEERKSLEGLKKDFAEMNKLEAARPSMIADIMKSAGPKPAAGLDEFLKGLSGAQLKKLEDDAAAAKKPAAEIATALLKARSGMLSFPPPAVRLGATSDKDAVGEAIGKLQAEASAQLALAGATDRTTAAMLFQKAAAEAEQKVSDLRVGLLTQEKSLQEQLANARANPTEGGQEGAKIEARIAGVHKELAALDAAAPQFRRLYAEIAAARASSSFSEELEKKSLDFGREIASIQELAAAYQSGGAAIAAAQIDKQLESEKQKLEDMRAEYAQLQAEPGPGIVAPAQGQGPAAPRDLTGFGAQIQAQAALIEKLTADAARVQSRNVTLEIQKQIYAYNEEAGAIAAVTTAYLQSDAARRAAQVGEEVAKFRTENPAADDTQVAQFADLAKKRSDQAFESSTLQAAAEYQIQAAYDRTREKLEAARAALVAAGESTLAIDDRIYKDELSHREELSRLTFDAQNSELIGLSKLYDANRQQIEQWEEMVSKVGTFGERFQEVANQIELAGANLTEKIFDSMSKTVDDISGQLAKLVVTGQSSFKKMFEGIAEQMLKASFQSTFANITKVIVGSAKPAGQQPGAQGSGQGGAQGAAGGVAGIAAKIFGVKTPGAENRPIGTSNDPIYVSIVDAIAKIKTPASSSFPNGLPLGPGFGSGKTSASLMSLLSPISNGSGGGDQGDLPLGPGFGSGLPSTNLMSLLSPESDSTAGGGGFLSSLTGIGGIFSKIFGGASGGGLLSGLTSIGKIFSSIPFLAAGGGANHGHAYVVGEKGPELFVPGISGTIIPTFSTMKPPKEGDQLGNMSRAFGGFRAAGGDVMPGRAYAVGEKHPEVFMPDVGSSSSSGAGSRTTNVNLGGFHVHGVGDADSFHRSQSQIYANLHAMMEGARDRG